MSLIKLIPTINPELAFEYIGLDAGAAFEVAGQRNFQEAQLWVDDAYVCTLRRASKAQGAFWMILQNPNLKLALPANSRG